jgi:hypothetical protein
MAILSDAPGLQFPSWLCRFDVLDNPLTAAMLSDALVGPSPRVRQYRSGPAEEVRDLACIASLRLMVDMPKLIWLLVTGFFRSRASLETKILTLRHQLNVLQRKAPKRLVFSNFDRFVFASLCRLAPGILNAFVIVKPETVIRWHRAGFRLFWQ